MQLIYWTKPKMIVSSEGKMIRSKNDIYIPAKYDEQGNLIEPEHKPYYSTTIFVPAGYELLTPSTNKLLFASVIVISSDIL